MHSGGDCELKAPALDVIEKFESTGISLYYGKITKKNDMPLSDFIRLHKYIFRNFWLIIELMTS